MELTVNVDLTLSDVTSQIGDRVSDVIVRHSQDGDLGDRAVPEVSPCLHHLNLYNFRF